jgi:hypothetical protein
VRDYAIYLGMDVEADPDLLFIAKYAMSAELPAEWTAFVNEDGEEYFYNAVTGVTQYEHPLDAEYQQMYCEMKETKQSNLARQAACEVERGRLDHE